MGLIRADGTDRIAPLHDLGTGHQTNPDWSPDGTQFVFAMSDGERDDLWIADADGGNPHVLLDCARLCRWLDDPDWSPDGERIVYSQTKLRQSGWGTSTLETIDVATGKVRVVLGPWKRNFTAGARYSPRRPSGRLREGPQDRPWPGLRHRRGHPERGASRPAGAPGQGAHRPAAVRRHRRLEPGREAHRLLGPRRARQRGAGPVLDPSRRRRTDEDHVPGRRRRLRRRACVAAGRYGPAVQRPAVRAGQPGAARRAPRRWRTRGPAFGDDTIYGRHPRVQPIP